MVECSSNSFIHTDSGVKLSAFIDRSASPGFLLTHQNKFQLTEVGHLVVLPFKKMIY